ncbi:protease [Streptomyces sp. 8K308]|uniref:S8 family peptidase n=1 Tax=Streptomyces sp. 8K308 TaxID=2530388 RepID=UPI001045F8C3|nr:S8 family peptidase [Streptomyces sp. 8K308]TDC12856.1 protease [Streptomyces sp. 8K308]
MHEEQAGRNVPYAWDLATGEGVNVAVIDTGHVTHSDLESRVVDGYDFVSDPVRARDGDGRDADYHAPGDWSDAGVCGPDEPARASCWHGTHVAGTVAAETGNAQGVASTAHGATVQPVRVLRLCGGDSSDIAEAIIWAAGGSVPGIPDNPTPAQVVNLSLGGKSPCATVYQDAIDFAVAQGATVVVAAGNANEDAAAYAPANCEDVITVAASNRAGDRAYFSNHGSTVEVTAPDGGGPNVDDNILSTYNSGTTTPADEAYWYLQGTSQATPHVAALAALLPQRDPALAPADVSDAVTSAARPIASCGEDCGAGLADAGAAVSSVG